MRQKLTKMSLKSFYGTDLLLYLGPAPKCGACTLRDTVKKKTVSFLSRYPLKIAAVVRDCLNFCFVVSWPCFFWYLPSPAGSYSVCLLCWVLWVLREGIWWRHSGLNLAKSLTLCASLSEVSLMLCTLLSFYLSLGSSSFSCSNSHC